MANFGAAALAPDGPRWVARACHGETQTDGRGVRWVLDQIEAGGRTLHWRELGTDRKARTEATAEHPDYPSDAAVLEAQRAERRVWKKAFL